MPRMMQSAVLERDGQPLVLRESALPEAGPGEIVVRTAACGVCHTDLHKARGDPIEATLPFISGHEGIGFVVAAGAGVAAVREGDRVGVPWLYEACGHCEHCLAARETVCAEARRGRSMRKGGFAGRILADRRFVAAEGKVGADIELQPLSAINDVFDRPGRGEVAARGVIDFAHEPGASAHEQDHTEAS